MTRTQAVSLFLAAVVVLTIAFATFRAIEARSNLVTTNVQEGSNLMTVGIATPKLSLIIARNCDGCSGGGSTGG